MAKLKNCFKQLTKIPIKSNNIVDQANLNKKHGGILGLCALINASPYDIPKYLPDILTHLCRFNNDPSPIKVKLALLVILLFDKIFYQTKGFGE